MTLPLLPPGYAASRADLHAVAEQVLAAARFAAVGRIGLAAMPGGFGTPGFPHGDRVAQRCWPSSGAAAHCSGAD